MATGVDRAQDLRLHLYIRANGPDTKPVVTSLGIVQWWEGKESRAHQCYQHAPEANPNYRLAQRDQLIAAGTLAPWAMDRNTAYEPSMSRVPWIQGWGVAQQKSRKIDRTEIVPFGQPRADYFESPMASSQPRFVSGRRPES